MPRARFELARLTAPPPQDGVSTSSTTWALRRGFLAKGPSGRKGRGAVACHAAAMRYPSIMETELRRETVHDLELPGACIGCGGAIVVRVTPGTARGVCATCHAITSMLLVRVEGGLQVTQAPRGQA